MYGMLILRKIKLFCKTRVCFNKLFKMGDDGYGTNNS